MNERRETHRDLSVAEMIAQLGGHFTELLAINRAISIHIKEVEGLTVPSYGFCREPRHVPLF